MIYEGQFKDDKWWGFGRAIYADGLYHIGYFKNDRKNGQGKSTYTDRTTGEVFFEEGFFENDKLITGDSNMAARKRKSPTKGVKFEDKA